MIIEVTPADFVCNIDKTGFTDWEDKKPKIVVVPAKISDDELHYFVNRDVSIIKSLLIYDNHISQTNISYGKSSLH